MISDIRKVYNKYKNYNYIDPNFDNYYIKTPKEFDSLHGGICWDFVGPIAEECVKEINKDLECSQLLYSKTEDVIGEFSDIKEVEGKYRIFEKVDCYLYLLSELEYTNDQEELSNYFLPKAREFVMQTLKTRVLDLCYFKDSSTREALEEKWGMKYNTKENNQ